MKLTYWTAPILVKRTFGKTIEDVCKHFDVTEEDIKLNCRKRIYNDPRSIIAYLLRAEHQWTLEKIGKYFNRTHATIIHHNNRVAGFMEVDKKYNQLVNSFK